ncbi:alpha/beta hydrolase [Actinomadura rugatobispora]|uniref:Alpha/beta hydrolase n=1 Tax=Actinomadura rugatobispora TaxID=1994 RepID=A0ABW1ABH7_9ACTN|nr:hypothetical protein GCM10010200_061070 [Actinomadura rugatobispora]
MRKVLVCGAAFAATCIAAVAVSSGAQATPGPTPTPAPSSPALPGLPGTPGATGSPGSQTPSAPGSASPSAPRTPRQPSAADTVVSARAVMVTPKPPNARTYAYGVHPRQRLDAYWRPAQQPARQGETAQAQPARTPGPAVLVFHGGSWISGDKSSWKYFARRLTAQGYTVFAANYRLATQAAWPAQRDDAVAALDFVKKNAARWNIDPGRVAVFGSSAGGLLASQLGTYGEGAQRVRGVLALSPVNTPYLAYQDGLKATATASQRGLRRAVTQLVGCVPNESDPLCWQRVEDSDSTTHVSAGDAPMLAMHAAEELVPAAHSNGLAAALRGAGVAATVKVVPGSGHASELLNDPTVYPAILNWLKARTR